jgi:hypothetical protein
MTDTRGCIGKIGYGTFGEAAQALSRIKGRRQEKGDELRPYRCRHCDRVHLGRDVRRTKERRARGMWMAKIARYKELTGE